MEASSNSNGNLGKKLEKFGNARVNSGLFFGLSLAKERSVKNFEDLNP
jgi:hypothetical protein